MMHMVNALYLRIHLLGDGIVLVMRQLAALRGEELEEYAEARGLSRYVGERSLKGEAELDWNNAKERTRLLREIVSDADRLLEEVREVRGRLAAGSAEDERLKDAAERLSQVLLQDIASLTGGRYFRATDPEALNRIFQQIDRLEKTPVVVTRYTQYNEAYQLPLLVGLAALALELLIATSIVVRVP